MLDFMYRSVILRYSEIPHPAAKVPCQFDVAVCHRDSPASSGQLLDPPLELGKGLVRCVRAKAIKSAMGMLSMPGAPLLAFTRSSSCHLA